MTHRQLASAPTRRDDLRLVRLARAASWVSAATGLGLLAMVPDTAGWAGLAALTTLLVAAPFSAQLRVATLRHAPTAGALVVLLLAWLTPLPPASSVVAVLAALLVCELLSGAHSNGPGRVPLYVLFAALLACTLTSTPLLAPLLLLALVSTASSLLLGNLCQQSSGAERSLPVAHPRHGLLGVGLMGTIVVLAALIFVAIPRHPDHAPRSTVPTHKLLGYSDQVRIGELAGALWDPTPLFRVRVTDTDGNHVPGPHHFRGVALDSFDGQTWSAEAEPGPAPTIASHASYPLEQSYRFEPTAPPILVGIPQLAALSVPLDELELAPSGTLLHRIGPSLHGYKAWSLPAAWHLDLDQPPTDDDAERPQDPVFVHLPTALDPRILEMAQDIAEPFDDDPRRAQAILTHLQRGYEYQRLPTAPMGTAPLDAFLLNTRSGHCELFATALAVMLRAVDIPTRVVNGFLGGEWNPVGHYWLVRHSDAHAWVEAWLPGRGWVPLDPTPPRSSPTASMASALGDHATSQWRHRVLDLDVQTQLQALAAPSSSLRRALEPAPSADQPAHAGMPGPLDIAVGLVIVALLAGSFVFGWRRLAPWLAGERAHTKPPEGEVERSLRAAVKALRARGWSPPQHLPPRSLARWLEERIGDTAQPLAALAELHYEVRYAGVADEQLAPAARLALSALRDIPKAPSKD